jgi:hypothetical protein
MSLLSLDDIVKSQDLEKLFLRIVKNNDIIKQIRNFGSIKYEEIEGFMDDPIIQRELERFGRFSILKKYRNQ